MDFQKELEELLNKHSKENGSDTPDYILAEYMTASLNCFNEAVVNRAKWHGVKSLPTETDSN